MRLADSACGGRGAAITLPRMPRLNTGGSLKIYLSGTPRRVRAVRCLVTAGVTLAAFCGTAPQDQAAALAATSAPTIDLASPTATVSDPAAGLTPVNTNCSAGQIDINKATATQISSSLSLPSVPTVNRLIALRPWLKGSDLSSVPGIGPSLAAALAQRTCATQPAPTTAQARACSSSSQVDLNSALPATMQTKLGLPATTVQALVAARPLPQDLSQVVAPRVPGFPQPTVDSLTSRGRICVTPAPYTAGATVYRWAYPDTGTVVRSGPYALIVPPGRIIAATGAYASVTPMAPDGGVLPKADSHIWGSWNAGTTTVAIQLPWSSTDPADTPAVIHQADDGDALSTGPSTALSTGADGQVVTAALSSLSASVAGTQQCGSEPSDTAFCDTLYQAHLEQVWKQTEYAAGQGALATMTKEPSCGSITNADGSVESSLSEVPFGVSCLTNTPGSDGRASWDLDNNAETDWGIAKIGVIYNYNVHPGGSYSLTSTGTNSESDFLLHELRDLLSQHGSLFGKQGLHISKAVDSPETNVDVTVNAAGSGIWSAIGTIVAEAPDVMKAATGLENKYLSLLPHGYTIEHLISDCVDTHGLTAGLVGCIKDVVSAAIDLVVRVGEQHPEDMIQAQINSLPRWQTAKRFLLWLDVGEALANFGFGLGTSLGGGAGVILRYNSPTPANPGGDSVGGAYGNPGGDGSYIVRDPSSGRSNLVKGNQNLSIPDGATFLCLAADRYVWDNAGMAGLRNRTTGQLPRTQPGTFNCPHSGAELWAPYMAQAQGGTIPNDVLLHERESDAGSNPIGSWLINHSGQIQSITGATSGGTFLCLSATHPVIWEVPFAAIQGWQSVGDTDAACP
jgi:DNA uptake protein ComE-like DNA-binding protein